MGDWLLDRTGVLYACEGPGIGDSGVLMGASIHSGIFCASA